ncbi:TspO/MBR family protein [Aurantimonas sp. HBX-1]|uniref:TspO/MBR family protein n=1 Tax=Aurantimonas sp. HBX-1 TaxID=2906072 RepID=UPI001F18E4B0|nr:TspO/MBR family protein [Aurantimonas sp. HBX-1]UIJ72669.1 tryptophan-rich sensory protein [Aurantimonas sp. HBX-1]
MRHPLLVLALFIALTVGGGGLIGLAVETGGWYAGLVKPSFNPPPWVFGPVWGILYLLIGIAGWRVWRHRDGAALRLWWLQLGLNFAWPLLFFGAQLIVPALVVLLALLGAILWFLRRTWTTDRPAALLFLPYAAWTAYAALLNGAIWWLN